MVRRSSREADSEMRLAWTAHSEVTKLVDANGGVRIPKPFKAAPHECELPDVDSATRLLAYRAPCGHLWRPLVRYSDYETYWEWRRVGPLRRWRWRKYLPR